MTEEQNVEQVRNAMHSYMRKLRERTGLSQQEVGNRVGVRQEAVAQWEREAGNPPGVTVIPKLAKLYNVDEKELLAERNRCKQKTRIAKSPEIGFDKGVRAKIFGYPLPCLEKIYPEDFTGQTLDALRDPETQWRCATLECDMRSFFFRNESEAMEPLIPKGALVAFDPMLQPKTGSIVLVRRKLQEKRFEWIIRLWKEEAGQKLLMGGRPEAWPTLELKEEDSVIAVAVEAHMVFPR